MVVILLLYQKVKDLLHLMLIPYLNDIVQSHCTLLSTITALLSSSCVMLLGLSVSGTEKYTTNDLTLPSILFGV